MKHFSLTAAIAVALLLGSAFVEVQQGHVSRADTVTAKGTASVMASPGEQSRVVTRVRSGEQLTVLAKKGRWLKVRVNGRTGWITQSNVASRQARATVSSNRRRAFVEGRSTARKKRSSAPRDRVGADAIDDEDDDSAFEDEEEDDIGDDEEDDGEDEEEEEDEDEDEDEEELDEAASSPKKSSVVALSSTRIYKSPSASSKSIHKAKAGDRLSVIQRDGGWIKVESDDGDVGWVRSKDVDEGTYTYDKIGYRYYAGLGYVTFAQAFTTPNDCDLCNYELSSGAAAIGAGIDVIYDYSKEYLLAADLAYQYTRAVPGIRFQDPATMAAADIGFQIHDIEGGIRGGYKLGKATGMAAYLRVGYLYHRFGINDVENFDVNLAKLPSEILSGVTGGIMLDVPRFNPKLAFRLGVNMLLTGQRVQTVGLEDGQVSTPSALWGAARVDYQWKPEMKISGQYSYTNATTKWAGQSADSQRDHGAASAEREDVTHTFFVGISKAI